MRLVHHTTIMTGSKNRAVEGPEQRRMKVRGRVLRDGEIRQIAACALVDHRSLRKALAGLYVRPYTYERIRVEMERRKLLFLIEGDPLREEATS